MKYLLFDHAGVLHQALNEEGQINEPIIRKINRLVDEGYQVLFHSSNNLAGQLDFLERLQMATLKKNLRFPTVVGIAVRDPLEYGDIKSSAPLIMMGENGLKIAAFGIKKPGKACIREALSVMLGIKPSDHKESIVFEDDLDHIHQAQKEGYQVKYIGGPEGLTLEKALDEVLDSQFS